MPMPAINTTGDFYPAYRSKNAHFDVETFACAERTVARLLDSSTRADDPARPGMLLGKVQSGKTRTFISIIAVAFDNEFDVAIILTKNSTALVQQTQQRVGSEFEEFVVADALDVYDIMAIPAHFADYELGKKLVFVVKKETRNLDRLKTLFQTNAPALATKRVLIIDDEADYASVGFSRKAGEVNANTITRKISELRTLLKAPAFLQVTATPYSLYLQPSDAEVPNVLAFKPVRPAFTELVPVPTGYVGGSFYFGDKARGEDLCVEKCLHHDVSERELDALKKSDARRFKLAEVLITPTIPALRHAIVNFVVGGCIRRLQAKALGKADWNRLKFSFLMHTEQKMTAHHWQEKVVEEIVLQLKAASHGSNPVFDGLVQVSHKDLAESVRLQGDAVPSLADVTGAVRQALTHGHVITTKVNSEEEVAQMLDKSGQLKLRCPFNIFIGGQVLDRGVTLNNLIGFYYGRRPQKFQQDTVLQHSRMFGYRPASDVAVTRFYTLNSVLRALFDIEDFDCTLRSAVASGNDHAVQFIRQRGDGTIVPCSPNKILISRTKTLRPLSPLRPFGFQTGYKTQIEKTILALDAKLELLHSPADDEKPYLIPIEEALAIVDTIERTVNWDDDPDYTFDWNTARAALRFLSRLPNASANKGKVWLLVRKDRNNGRFASVDAHAKYIGNPDTRKTEGKIASDHAVDNPMLMLFRQNGTEAIGWRGTPFYWPVLYPPVNTPTSIYAEEVDDPAGAPT
ncbi:MAG: hypothetical protein EBY17_24460 [Acidobacteriia bacterium]|nr:hypothetical protein [Terriglobia bacterium]